MSPSTRAVKDLVIANRTEAWVVAVMLMLFVGLVCEDLGSHLEGYFDDRRDTKDGTHKANWHSYLRIAHHIEPVGHHYLRTVLLRLKFELGSAVACVFGFFGMWWLPVSFKAHLLGSVIAVGVAVYFAWEARESHKLLSDIRAVLLTEGCRCPGQATNTSQAITQVVADAVATEENAVRSSDAATP